MDAMQRIIDAGRKGTLASDFTYDELRSLADQACIAAKYLIEAAVERTTADAIRRPDKIAAAKSLAQEVLTERYDRDLEQAISLLGDWQTDNDEEG